jgi:hypothetical protein
MYYVYKAPVSIGAFVLRKIMPHKHGKKEHNQRLSMVKYEIIASLIREYNRKYNEWL